jgi:hypothetical protein
MLSETPDLSRKEMHQRGRVRATTSSCSETLLKNFIARHSVQDLDDGVSEVCSQNEPTCSRWDGEDYRATQQKKLARERDIGERRTLDLFLYLVSWYSLGQERRQNHHAKEAMNMQQVCTRT